MIIQKSCAMDKCMAIVYLCVGCPGPVVAHIGGHEIVLVPYTQIGLQGKEGERHQCIDSR